jgi:hypothetical protein
VLILILKPSLAAQNATTASGSSGAITDLSLSIAIAYFCRSSIICLSVDLYMGHLRNYKACCGVVVVVVEIDQQNESTTTAG